MEWQVAALEEYKALRREILDTMRNQQMLVHVGAITIGLILAWGFHEWDRSRIADLVFLVFVPAMAYVVLILWMGEVARMMRVGLYLADREKEISASFTDHPGALNWENWLRTRSGKKEPHRVMLNYLAIVVLYLSAALVGIAVGNYRLADDITTRSLVILDGVELLAFLATALYVFKLSRQFKSPSNAGVS